MDTQNAVKDNKQRRRFEMELEEGQTAFISYVQRRNGAVALTHTEVPDAFEGKGVGGALVKNTLELLQKEGRRIVPLCSFVAGYLRRHPEYQSLVDPE